MTLMRIETSVDEDGAAIIFVDLKGQETAFQVWVGEKNLEMIQILVNGPDSPHQSYEASQLLRFLRSKIPSQMELRGSGEQIWDENQIRPQWLQVLSALDSWLSQQVKGLIDETGAQEYLRNGTY